MSVLGQARQLLADAVTFAGTRAGTCSKYQPEVVGGYGAWIGTVVVDRRTGAAFNRSQLTAEVVTVGPANDRPTTWAALEEDVDRNIDALEAIPGLAIQVTGTATGVALVGEDHLPAVTYTCAVSITTGSA